MKFIKKIKTLFIRSDSRGYEKIILSNKQCPQCASRGIYIFKSNPKHKAPIGQSNENKS